MVGLVEYAFDVEGVGFLSGGDEWFSCDHAAGSAVLDDVLIPELLKKLVLHCLR